MNQLFEIEFNINSVHNQLIRDGGNGATSYSRFTMGEVMTFLLPEVVLPTKETQMLYKKLIWKVCKRK